MKPSRLLLLAALPLALVAGGSALYAQLEGADRGVPPINTANTLEVTGVEVDVVAENADAARFEGWRIAQSRGWQALWAKTHNRPISEAPQLSESVLNGMVSGIIIEHEQIGPRRYIARLGVLFDRARAGQLLGVRGHAIRSAPMLVIPIMQTGSALYSFEFRNEWQRVWARFRTADTPIDYVRTSGAGIDPLLLNAMQTRRPGRGWWRMLLDQYGAADIVVPEVWLRRSYPGGPATGVFTARHGPDNIPLARFTLRVSNSAAIPRLLEEGVRRIDAAYVQALLEGRLTPDPSLVVEEPEITEAIAKEVAKIEGLTAPDEAEDRRRERDRGTERDEDPTELRDAPGLATGGASVVTIQVDTPTAGDVTQAEISVSRVPGVTSAIATSRAVGGTSTVRATYAGDPAALRAALEAQGWSVSGSGTFIRISRPGGGQ